MTTSPQCMLFCIASVLPTRTKVCTSTREASLTTMDMQAGPIPLDSVEIGAPLYLPENHEFAVTRKFPLELPRARDFRDATGLSWHKKILG